MLNILWKRPLNLGWVVLLGAGLSFGLVPGILWVESVAAQEEIETLTNEEKKAEGDRLLRQGIDQFNRSQFREATISWQSALEIYRAIEDMRGEAEALKSLGNAYVSLGQYQEAIAFYEQSLEISRAIEYVQGEANSLMNLGITHFSLGQYQEAITFYEQSLEIFQAIEDSQGEAKSLGNLGNVYASLGQYREAIAFYEQSLKAFQTIEDVHGQAALLNNLGDVYRKLGQYREAIAYFKQSLETFQVIENMHGEASGLMNLGATYYSLGQYREAIAYYEQSLEIFQAIEAVQSEANALNNIGAAYNSLGQYQEAITYLKQSLEIFQSIDDPRGEAFALNSLGNVYQRLGQYQEAIAYHEQSLEIRRAIEDVQGEASSLGNLGATYLSLEQYQEAIGFSEEALAIFQNIEDIESEGITLNNLGIAYQDQGDTNLAITFFKASVNVREGIRTNIRDLSPDIQSSYTETVAATYRRLISLLLEQGRIGEAQQVLELLKAQEVREFTRATVTSTGRIEPTPAEAAILEENDQYIAQLIDFGRQLDDCRTGAVACTTAEQDALIEKRTALSAEYGDTIRSFEAEMARRREVDPSALDTSKFLERAIGVVEAHPNTVMIYPIVLEDEVWILWATAGRIANAIKLENVTPAQLSDAVFRFGNHMKTCEYFGCRTNNIPEIQAISKELYDYLIAPIEPDLQEKGIENLVFSLDRVTRYIPMAALYDGNQYLIEKYTVTTVLSDGFTDDNNPLPAANDISVLGLGLTEAVPDLDPTDDIPEFRALQHVRSELDAIVQSPNSIFKGLSFFDQTFDRTAFNELERGRYNILHIATHGVFVPAVGDQSYLLLGTKEDWRTYEIRDLSALFYDLSLVVLSACQTGLGETNEAIEALADTRQEGMEITGVAYAFIDAGVDTVIASLWQVNDESTSLLMQSFYDNLATSSADITIAHALRDAQLQMLNGESPDDVAASLRGLEIEMTNQTTAQSADHAHPFYWAPFVIIGNGL